MTIPNQSPSVRVPRLRPYLGRLWYGWRDRRHLARVVSLAPEVLRQLPEPADPPWRILDAQWSRTGAAVVLLGPEPGATTAVLKAAFSPASKQGLRVQASTLSRLQARARLGEWRTLLPRTLAEGEIAGLYFTLEEALPGISAEKRLADGEELPRLLALAAEAIRPLYQETAVPIASPQSYLERAVAKPIALIRRAARSQLLARREPFLDRLAQHLRLLEGPLGESAVAKSCWVHGDYWLGNVLVGGDGPRVSGLIDWTMAEPGELPLHDALHLVLHARQLAKGQELGDVVAGALEAPGWEPHERAVLALLVPEVLEDPGSLRAAVLLYWLRRLRLIAAQGGGHLENRVWVAWNVDRVLQCL